MADELLILQEKPAAEYLIAGWRRQWGLHYDSADPTRRCFSRSVET